MRMRCGWLIASSLVPPLCAALLHAGVNICSTVEKLNLGQYTAPVVGSVSRVVGPYFRHATNSVLPLLTPYLDLAAPYIGGAKPHLEKVSQAETLLILGQYRR
jgi:hypothetical protein